ncbi:MAG: hypothetical protein AAF944_24565 [Bacteroidota bacterium]
MPANPKYLSNPWKRFSKLMAAIFGGLFVTGFLHAAIGKHVADPLDVTMSTQYTLFFVWIGFMVLAYVIKKAWHVWALYVGLSLLFFLIAYL